MKRFSLILVSFAFIGFLASCGGNTEKKATDNKDAQKEEVKADSTQTSQAATADFDLVASVKAGEAVYTGKGNCATCHMTTGQGVAGAFPPLVASDYLADKANVIKVILNGLTGDVTVNGTKYSGAMPPVAGLTDEETRDLVNYVLNTWDNKGGHVTLADVQAAKAK